MNNLKLKVSGMHCRSCETLIKETLEETKGIFTASADLKKKTVTVLYNNDKISAEEIRKMIEELGYKTE
mgnify:CR=1 FL=1